MAIRKKKLRHRYNESVDVYDDRYQDIQRRKFEAVREDLSGSRQLLDVGCGTGMFLDELASEAELVVGVDLSGEMLKKVKMKNEKITLVCSDADKLPFRDESFDGILALTLLQNMPDARHTIHELTRVAKRGGIIAITSLRKKHSASQIESWAISANLKPIRKGKIPNSEDVLCVARREK